ncbi:MAG: N-acetylglucosaminyl-diphospho-decaprenol L-rhamnosyltransferase [Acidimicrobiia bacterium]|nr:N-acetylglucosaminyl-diphospho-decaprenol L-rhamnosyltransferase [Acidimicrobiia bacterium]
MPEVSVLLVGYRTRDELSRCLSSLVQDSSDVDLEIVLVDNASGDGTADFVRREFPQVELIELEHNIGFARAVNRAAETAAGEYLLLLNPDTEVLPGAVAALLSFARANPQAGLVGGRTLTADRRTEPSCCWGAPTLWSTFCFGSGLQTAFRGHRLFDPESLPGWDRDTVREVGVVTGCLLLCSAATWKDLGGFDQRFFMYGEDTDLSMRAAEHGYRPAITPAAEVIHTIGASSSVPTTRRVMIMRGKVSVSRLHWSPGRARLGVAMLLAGVGLRAGLGTVAKRVRGQVSSEQEAWIGAWTRRREWLDGYPDYDPLGPADQGRPDEPGSAAAAPDAACLAPETAPPEQTVRPVALPKIRL